MLPYNQEKCAFLCPDSHKGVSGVISGSGSDDAYSASLEVSRV